MAVPYTAAGPAMYRMPPSAGPLTIATCMAEELQATALGRSFASTMAAMIAW